MVVIFGYISIDKVDEISDTYISKYKETDGIQKVRKRGAYNQWIYGVWRAAIYMD